MKHKTTGIHRCLPAVMAAIFLFSAAGTTAYAADDEAADREGITEASVSFTAGKLKLVSVPMLDFGTHSVSAAKEYYPADSVSQRIQVSDLRGSGKGWDLMVSLSEFVLEADSKATLQAARIEIDQATVEPVNDNKGTPPVAAAPVSLESDNTETPVWKAAQSEGMGVWDLVWDPAATKLHVMPGTAQEGRSVATLTWSLQTTP